MKVIDAIKEIQKTLGFQNPDGDFGQQTKSRLWELISQPSDAQWPTFTPEIIHEVKATSFADPQDIAAFHHAKAHGMSDEEAFRHGDNGIGKWGDFTGDPDGTPMCALPPEDWADFGESARGKKINVTHNGITVLGELRDTMPWRKDITNGAGIDLNPAFLKAFNLTAPIIVSVSWSWA